MFPAGDVGVVEGEMNVPNRGMPTGDSMEFNTLDEPIKETFVWFNSINIFLFIFRCQFYYFISYKFCSFVT